MSSLQDMISKNRPSSWRFPSRILMVMVAAVLIWAWKAPLTEVAVAPGEVAPRGKTKIVQHLEGGIIRKIFVSEGQTVRTGDAIMRLELGTQRLNHAELQAELDVLKLAREPWVAEIKGQPVTFDQDIIARRPQDARREKTSFDARQEEIKSAVDVIRKQVNQRELTISTFLTKRQAVENDLELARQNLGLAENAVSQGLGSLSEVLPLRREVAQLVGAERTFRAEILQARGDLKEAQSRINELRKRYRNAATRELGQIDRRIATITESLVSATEQVKRTEVVAPIEGIVKSMRYNTLGGIVKPGEPILEIVPLRDDLVIEARLRPEDRGYVRVGSPANIKVSTYDYTRYGTLDGKVTLIGADADKDRDGNPYFRIVVQADRLFLGDSSNPLPVSPGMQTTVDILTGERTVFEYFTRPVLKLRHDAFRER